MGTTSTTAGRRGARWAFLEPQSIGAEDDPYLDRLRLFQCPWFGVLLHRIHRADRDRDPHDHPWSFWSIPLCGGYQERVWPDKRDPANWVTRERSRFTGARRGRRCAHIITRVDGTLWTLVVTGPRRGDWGFWENGKLVPWQEYVSRGLRGRQVRPGCRGLPGRRNVA